MSSHAAILVAVSQQLTRKGLQPRAAWLEQFAATVKPTTPIPALVKTAEFRLLQTDITETLLTDAAHALPATATDANVREQQLQHSVVVQVVDVEDLSRSRWSQIELIEQQERGEMTKGREIIRVIADSEDRGPPAPEPSKGPHKLLVQDVKGLKMYAFELTPIPGVGVTMATGSKILIRSARIARGMILLDPGNAKLLGGTIKSWADEWAKDRKQTLKSHLPTTDEPRDST